MDPMSEMFARAEREGLWFFSPYQQMWFSPESLRTERANGSFRWGSANWELRDPQERLQELRREEESARERRERFETLLGA